ncbi:hypothetical protein C0991_011123 [Blastosporella zonata]|nr:hypothetical protein C0991_011123 [Blastosporella zonata]
MVSLPTSELAKRTTFTASTTGTQDDYFYSLYMEESSGASLDVETGSYSLAWTSVSEDVVAGVSCTGYQLQRHFHYGR